MAQRTQPPSAVTIDDILHLMRDPEAYEQRMTALREAKAQADAAIALVGPAQQIPQLLEDAKAAAAEAAAKRDEAARQITTAQAEAQKIVSSAHVTADAVIAGAKVEAQKVTEAATAKSREAAAAADEVSRREAAVAAKEAEVASREAEAKRKADEADALLADLSERRRQVAAILGEPQ